MLQSAPLEQKLDHYSTTAKGQTKGRSLSSEIAGFAAAAGAGLAMAGTADAAIIYSGVLNIAVSMDHAAVASSATFFNGARIGFDLDGDSINDFVAVASMLASANATGVFAT